MAGVAEIILACLAPAVEVGKCITAPIKRQFNYLCCFNSNIRNLRDEAKKLDDATKGLQMQVDAARDSVEVIIPEVETWLQNANGMKENMSRLEGEIPKVRNAQSGCLAIKARYSLTKRAKKAAEHMKHLQEVCKFNSVSVPAPTAATEPVPLGTVYEFESRKQIEEDIMTTLRSKNENMIGICGMGGVGKTTMAKKIMNRVREENLFDEAVVAVVSQIADKLRIQLEIAELLGLKLEEETLPARAHKLRARLTGTKRILIVLDDVWESLKLEDIGIPCESDFKGCTVLLTSRNRDVLTAMNVQKVYGLQILSEGEARILFREKAGTCVDDPILHSIAEEVIEECKGLPIALIIVASVLKDESSISIWKDALQQLKRSNPGDIPEVYNSLKLSYDFLRDERAKSLFLLFCLFHEDANIPLEYVTYFAVGLHLFEGIRNLEDTRNRICRLIKTLKNRFLLLDGSDEYHVRMHDIVRDVSIFIAKQEGYINGNNCTWISSFVLERAELPLELGFPNLRLLFIDDGADGEFQINDSFIKATTKLNVLFIKNSLLESLPHATKLLKNLQTLVLDGCLHLENISIVGELENLEILICRHLPIYEFQLEIGKLNRLRLLEVLECRDLVRIAPGVISSLVGLEELKIVRSFDEWEANGSERENAMLSELESLSNLTCLEIEVKDSTLAAQDMNLSSKIVKYHIAIGSRRHLDVSWRFEREMILQLPREITLGNWICELVTSVEYLYLYGSRNLNLAQAKNMRSLTLIDCSTSKKVVRITSSSIHDGRCGATSTLVIPLPESLVLSSLPNLEEICDIEGSPSHDAMKNLKVLELKNLPALRHLWKSPSQNYDASLLCNLSSIGISKCDSLQNLFSFSMAAKDCLLQLETLVIGSCKMMEQVFLWNEEQNGNGIRQQSHHITFSKLKTLILLFLPNLANFCKGIEGIEFPVLTEMKIYDCPNLKSLVSSSRDISGGHDDDDHSLHLFCKREKVSFGSGNLKKITIEENNYFKNIFCGQTPFDIFIGLQDLWIEKCGNVRSLFSFSIAQNLVNLRELGIEDCRELVKVIEDETEKDACESRICLFPNLKELYLFKLPKLKSFCEWRCALELPLLEKVYIDECPEMERFNLGSLTTPNKKTLKIDSADNIVNANKYLKDVLQIEELVIRSCQIVLVLNEEENQKDIGPSSPCPCHFKFLKLKTLILQNLPRLIAFCKGIENIEFPMLTKMNIKNCPELKSLVSTTTTSNGSGNNHNSSGGISNDHDHDCLHLFCKPEKVAFGSLEKLWISGYNNMSILWCDQIPIDFFTRLEKLRIIDCGNIRSLFSFSVARSLVNLKQLIIKRCEKVVKIIEDDDKEKDGSGDETTCLFPKLETLKLVGLSKLKSFCEWRYALELQSLEKVKIRRCPEMERFSLGSLSTPRLRRFKIGGEYLDHVKDLNGALQQQEAESTSSKIEEEEEGPKEEHR